MRRRSVTPLLIGTLILRTSSGASTIIVGLLLAQLSVRTAHSINSLEVGLLPVVFYITELTLAPFMGALSDRWGRRAFMVVGPVFGLLQAGLYVFTPSVHPLPYLLALQALAGISGAMSLPAVLSYLADYTATDRQRRMRVMSFYELVTSGGIAAGTVVGGFAWEHFERLSFLLLAASYCLVILCMFLAPKVGQIVDRGDLQVVAKRYWRLLRTPRLFIFIPAWLCISALVGIWLSSQLTFILSAPSHHRGQHVMGSMGIIGGGHTLSLVLGGFVLFFGLSLLFWAFFLNRVPRLRLMLISVGGVYLACLALGGINHIGTQNGGAFIWIPLLLGGIFAETSFAPSALAYLADISEEASKDRGLVMGLYSIFLGLGQILGNGLGGIFAHNFGFDGLIYLTIILATVALGSLLLLYRYERHRLNWHVGVETSTGGSSGGEGVKRVSR
jgi:MFS family permease